jgi:aspartate aminotransferase
MFEEGALLKATKGPENVFDFSLGNPFGDPPPPLARELARLAASPPPDLHKYMPNAGFQDVRQSVADDLNKQTGLDFTPGLVVMTVGAAGALNVALRSILSPGDEVIIVAPYFVEYMFYIRNAGGVPVVAESAADFQLDIDAVRAAITGRTKALIINTPNNPTGAVYPANSLKALSRVLSECEARTGGPIYVLSDEPYRKIVYQGSEFSPPAAWIRNTLVAYSHSKDLNLPGERIGYLAVSPMAADSAEVADACVFCNRVLGFVNAPSIMQRAVAGFQGIEADMTVYRKNRDMLVETLLESGFSLVPPGGAFYLFPKSPGDDEMKFIGAALEENILVVPGSGFGRKGHFRAAYCMAPETVERSLPAWRRVGSRFFGRRGGRS